MHCIGDGTGKEVTKLSFVPYYVILEQQMSDPLEEGPISGHLELDRSVDIYRGPAGMDIVLTLLETSSILHLASVFKHHYLYKSFNVKTQ